jgi:DnaA family protein
MNDRTKSLCSEKVSPQMPLNVMLRDELSLETFYAVGNESVLADLERYCLMPAEYGLLIQGSAGSGKTHLLQAWVQRISSEGGRALYVPLSQLCDYSTEVLEGLETMDLVALDDLDQIAGNREWEVALFHYLNRAWAKGQRTLMSSRHSPLSGEWELPDLVSRLGWGIVSPLKTLSDPDKMACLQFRSRLRGIEMPENVAHYLLTRFSRDMAGLYQVLIELDRATLKAKRALTLPFVKQMLVPPSEQDDVTE